MRRRRRRAAACASAAWSTSSSRCRTPSTRCGAIRLRGLLGAAEHGTAERRRVAVGGAALRRGLLRPVERDLPAHPGARLARLRGAGRMARAFGHGAAQARVAVRPGRAQGGGADGLFQQTGHASLSLRHRRPARRARRALRRRLVARRAWPRRRRSRSRTPRAPASSRVGAAESPVGVDFEDLGRIQQPELMVGIADRRRARHGRRPGRRRARRAAAAPLVRQGSGGQVPGHRPAGPARGLRGRLRRRRLRPRAGRLRGRDDRTSGSSATAPR